MTNIWRTTLDVYVPSADDAAENLANANEIDHQGPEHLRPTLQVAAESAGMAWHRAIALVEAELEAANITDHDVHVYGILKADPRA